MVCFSEYEVDTVRVELRRGGRLVKIQRRPCELLLFLIEKQGAIVTREQIAEELWGDGVHVDAEHNINTIIRKIRYALRDDAERQRYVQTVVGRGYRFIAEVSYTDPSELARSAAAVIYDATPPVTETAEQPDSTSDRISPDLSNDSGTALPVVTDRSWIATNDRLWMWVTILAIGICAFAAIVLWRSQQSSPKSSQSAASQKPASIPGPSKIPAAQHAAARTDYLRGRYFWNKRTLQGLEKSIAYYRHALTLDPDYADAYAALGDAYVLLSSYGGPEPSQSLKIARENATRALQLNPQLGEAHTVLAAVKVDLDWDWYGASDEYQKAILLSPQYPTAHHWYALHLSRLGRHAEAESEIQQALQLDPLSLIIETDAAEIAYRAGDLARATTYLQKAIELDPNFADAHMIWGEVNEQKKDFVSAIKEFGIAERLFHGAPNVVALAGHAFALAGQRERALKIAHDLEDLSKRRYVSGVDIGIVYCGLGDSQNAMKWLESAYEYRDKGLNILAADPLFNACRTDPRFTDLLTRLHLPIIKLGASAEAVQAR
jgi:DNA-binding winged helix-turn-helix (wHTH) protein/tetratricopeptide (TPR) repeat protein